MGLHGAPRITIETCVARARMQGKKGKKEKERKDVRDFNARLQALAAERSDDGLRAASDARLRTEIHSGSFIISSKTDDLSVGPSQIAQAVALPETICPYQRTKTAEIN